MLANTQLLFRAHCEMVPQNDSKTIQIHENSLTEVEALQDCCLRLMIVNESYPFGRIHAMDSMETYTKLISNSKATAKAMEFKAHFIGSIEIGLECVDEAKA